MGNVFGVAGGQTPPQQYDVGSGAESSGDHASSVGSFEHLSQVGSQAFAAASEAGSQGASSVFSWFQNIVATDGGQAIEVASNSQSSSCGRSDATSVSSKEEGPQTDDLYAGLESVSLAGGHAAKGAAYKGLKNFNNRRTLFAIGVGAVALTGLGAVAWQGVSYGVEATMKKVEALWTNLMQNQAVQRESLDQSQASIGNSKAVNDAVDLSGFEPDDDSDLSATEKRLEALKNRQ